MRLDPMIIDHLPEVCVQCHRCIIEGIIYVDVDTPMKDVYCRQCVDEMCCFPPYRSPRRVSA